MDYRPEPPLGQQQVIISVAVVAQIAQLCDYVLAQPNWHAYFKRGLYQFDELAAAKALNQTLERAATARDVATSLGLGSSGSIGYI